MNNQQKNPIVVTLAIGWLAFWAVALIVFGFVPHPYSSQPWTMCAINFLLAAELLYLRRIISRRNLAGVLTVALPLFAGICWFMSFAAAVMLVAIPLAVLALPLGIRWLKSDSHFSWVRLLVMAVLIGVGGMIHTSPSLTANDISNINPIIAFMLGNGPLHSLDERGEHTYSWWECGGRIGTCLVHYDLNHGCSALIVHKHGWGSELGEYYDAFVSEVKEKCEWCYGNEIKWSEQVSDDGCVKVVGWMRDELAVEIMPGVSNDLLGIAKIYNPRLYPEPNMLGQESVNALFGLAARIMNEAYTALNNGESPKIVAERFCEKSQELHPDLRLDPIAMETLFRTYSVYGAKYTQVACEFFETWQANFEPLINRTSADWIFSGGAGCRARLLAIGQTFDRWVQELSSYSKRMEGAGRIISADGTESIFNDFQEGLMNSMRPHRDLQDLFARQYEILLFFADNGQEDPRVPVLIDELAVNQGKLNAMIEQMQAQEGKILGRTPIVE